MKKWFLAIAVFCTAAAYSQQVPLKKVSNLTIDEETLSASKTDIEQSINENGSIKILTNPSGKYMRLESGEGKMKSIVLYDAFLRKVHAYYVNAEKVLIYIGKLIPEVYYVRVRTGKSVTYNKVQIEPAPKL
jgi:hypothetical protein